MGDPVQPEWQRGSSLELIEVPPGPQEGLLGQVFRGLAVAGEIEEVAIDAGIVLLNETVARRRIALAQSIQELGFRCRRGAVPSCVLLLRLAPAHVVLS